MLLDLIDFLRCPRDHEESVLVAGIERQVGRDIEQGSLGCPVCLARFPIHAFVADFAGRARSADRPEIAANDADLPETPLFPAAASDPAEAATRAAAMLDARIAGAWHVLVGRWGMLGPALVAAFDVRAVLLDPPPSVAAADGVSILRTAPNERLPLASGLASGMAIDRLSPRGAELLRESLRLLRGGGRLVVPAGAALPEELNEIARDDRWCVSERAPLPAAPVPLRRLAR